VDKGRWRRDTLRLNYWKLEGGPIDIQHELEVLQRFKAAHKPLVKALFSFENMESHGEPIKLVLR
jgi:hypothetical protein